MRNIDMQVSRPNGSGGISHIKMDRPKSRGYIEILYRIQCPHIRQCITNTWVSFLSFPPMGNGGASPTDFVKVPIADQSSQHFAPRDTWVHHIRLLRGEEAVKDAVSTDPQAYVNKDKIVLE